MEERFTLYDIIGILIPGAISLLLLIKAINYLGVNDIQTSNFTKWYGAVIFVIFSYVSGQVIQWIAKQATKISFIRKSWYQSSGVFSQDNKSYTEYFKNDLFNLINNIFKIPSSETTLENPLKESFDLVYAFVTQNKLALNAEIYYALFGLFRGLFVISLFGFVSAALFILCHSRCNVFLPSLNIITLMLLLFILILWVSFERAEYFSRLFVDSIYRSFYVYFQSRRN